VLAVVFFHLLRHGLPGGYLGVDMFFVLSGYLITAIIHREAQAGDFSLARFYERRVRRIMPALLAVLALATVAAVLLLLPADLIGYAKSLLATLVFCANFYFWRDTDYFAAAAAQKPLLHIWSLGVEEQFYIVFPLLLVALARWWPRGTLPAIVALALASFAANVLANLAGATLPAFFLLPTRAWELGAGAALAVLPVTLAPQGTPARAAAWLGIALIAAGILVPFGEGVVPVALPVVAGTVLLVLSGVRAAPLPNRLLGLRPVVFVGLISYSLYLWHWPIIVFGQYYLVRAFTAPEVLLALALMLACAVLSWRYVERPFRNKELRVRTVCAVAAGAALLLAGTALLLLRAQGLPSRFSAAAAALNEAVGTNYRCPIADYLPFGRSRACLMNLPSRAPRDAQVVLLGNSHAQMYAPLWARLLAQRGETGLLVPVNGCLPTVSVNISRACAATAAGNLAAVTALPRAHTVILGLNWVHDDLVDANGRPAEDRDSRALLAGLDDLIGRLRGAGRRVVLIGPLAEPGWDVPSTLARELAFSHPPERLPYLPSADFYGRFGAAIAHFEHRSDVTLVRPDLTQCQGERCYYVRDGRSLFSDSNHLAGAALPQFQAAFAAALDAPQAATER
jgi:peptidoglycan/LPS O-acetylase OafA/YrhL